MKILPLLFLGGATLFASSSNQDIIRDMQAYKKSQTQNIAHIKKDNLETIKQNKFYYTKITDASSRYYKKYLSKKWGKNNVRLSNKSTFTQYSKDMNERESIDYKNGMITIEMISDKKRSVNLKKFNERLSKLSTQTLSQSLSKDPVAQLEKQYLIKKKIVKPYVIKNKTHYLNGLFENKALQEKDVQEKEITLDNGEKKFIQYVNVPMVPNHLEKRALKYKSFVLQKSKEYNIPPSVVFATIQTESYFNPLAKSHVPAYGLMQIVPTTAGVDAYYALTKTKKILSPSYLYDEKNNITIGTKYIQIIRENYLKGVHNEKSLLYCAAISYNAGIGSLVYSLTGSKRKRLLAIKMINKMTPEQLYKHLRTSTRLTHEARNYVKSISERSRNYLAWDTEV
jgi:membrane-bound lytic murein transglycosylase C